MPRQDKAPLCAQLNSDRTLAVMLSLFMPRLSLDSQASSLGAQHESVLVYCFFFSLHQLGINPSHATQAIKLQVNHGGCFPCHFDSDETLDTRKITAIFYLNPG